MQKQNLFKTKGKPTMLALACLMLLAALITCGFGLGASQMSASAAEASSTQTYLNIQMPSGTSRLGMCVYINDRPDAWDMGYYPEDVIPNFNGTLYLYFTPQSGTNIYSGHYVTITGATLTGTKDLYVGVQGSWYSFMTVPSGEYEISRTLYDLLVNFPNYTIRITTDLTKVGQTTSDTSKNWVVCLCTDIDKDPNNQTYASATVGGSRGITVTPIARTTLPPDPVLQHHTFAGWYLDAGLTQPYDGRAIFEDTSLYAKFIPLVYRISFISNTPGVTVSDMEVTALTAAGGLPTLTRTGYTFTGWYLDAGLTQECNGITSMTGDITLYAGWEPIILTVTFYVSGEVYITMEVAYGTTLSEISEDPALAMYSIQSVAYPDDSLDKDNGLAVQGEAEIHLEKKMGIDGATGWVQANLQTILWLALGGVGLIAAISLAVFFVRRSKNSYGR